MMKRRALLHLSSSQYSTASLEAYPLPSFVIPLPSSSVNAEPGTPPILPSPAVANPADRDHRQRPMVHPFSSPHDAVDYFTYKEQTYFSSNLSKPRTKSHFSPMITPAAPESLTRPASPVLLQTFIPHRLPPTSEASPTLDGDPFPYIANESTYAPLSPGHSMHSRPKVSSPLVPADVFDVKVYFSASDELVKLRLNQRMSFADVVRTAAKRMPRGWQSLHAADPGVEVADIASTDTAQLTLLATDADWQDWLNASIAQQRRRLVLWAV